MATTPNPLPLSVETACPRCQQPVTVRMLSAGATAQVTAVTFTAEYQAHHRCPDQFEDPWTGVPAPSPEDMEWAVPKPRTDEP